MPIPIEIKSGSSAFGGRDQKLIVFRKADKRVAAIR